MPRWLLLFVLAAIAPVADGSEGALTPGTRIRLSTGTPPWTEEKGVREIRGHVLREDENTLTFEPLEGGEPSTRTKKGRWLIGEFVRSDETHFVVRRPGEPEALRIPAVVVSRVEVSRRNSRARSGMIGAGVGAAFFALLGASSEPCSGSRARPSAAAEPGEWNPFDGLCIFTRSDMAALGAMSGAVLGGVIGLSLGDEKWRPVEVPRVRLSVTPLRGGASARVAFRF